MSYICISLPNKNRLYQMSCCLFPPLALQLGSASFQDGYSGWNLFSICAEMIVDIPIYIFLTWYIGCVKSSKYNAFSKSWHFLFTSYWYCKGSINTCFTTATSNLTEYEGLPTVVIRGFTTARTSATEINTIPLVDVSFDLFEGQVRKRSTYSNVLLDKL